MPYDADDKLRALFIRHAAVTMSSDLPPEARQKMCAAIFLIASMVENDIHPEGRDAKDLINHIVNRFADETWNYIKNGQDEELVEDAWDSAIAAITMSEPSDP